ncbi:MAG: AAA family ATPase [Promethearchaeota archaeon]
MKRVLVLGPAGSGKSTFAENLAKKLDVPCIHLDSHYWRPNWIGTPKEEWPGIVQSLVAREEWVMDGNYSTSLEMRIQRADTAIFLDIPRRISYWRILKRRILHRGQVRPEMPEGCYEKIDLEFIKWIWGFPKRSRWRVLEILDAYADTVQVAILRNSREMDEFLKSIDS